MMIRIVLALIAAFSLFAPSSAAAVSLDGFCETALAGPALAPQFPEEYPTSLKSKGFEARPGGKGEAKITFAMDEGWHIYGLPTPENEDFVTSFSIVSESGVTLDGAMTSDRKSKLHKDKYSEYDYFEGGEVTFTVPLKWDASKGMKGELKVTIITCTWETCKDPKSFVIALEAEAEEGAPSTPEDPAASNGEASEPESSDGGAGSADPTKGKTLASFVEDPEPGRIADMLIPLTEGMASAGDVVSADKIKIFSDHLVADDNGKVEAEGPTGLRLRVPMRVKDALLDGAAIDVGGLVVFASGPVSFAVKATVNQPVFSFLLAAALAALIALLTPCVFPMIPITISFFTKQAETSKTSPIVMGLVYGAGIVISFTLIGVLFTALTGSASAFATHPITLGTIAALFILFALSLFGMFEIQLPASLMGLVGKAQGKGGMIGVWLLGTLFAITTFTCTAPFVGSLLASAASSGEWTRPVLGMVVFSGVLAIPFILLSIFPSKLKSLPRAGGWLNEVKVVMGFIELAAAFKFLGDMDGTSFFTRASIICAWAAIFFACGLYLLGVFRMPHDSPREKTPVLALILALIFIGFALYVLKGLDGEALHSEVDVYLPREVHERTPRGRRQELIDDIRRGLGTASIGASGQGGAPKEASYDNKLKNKYDDSRAIAVRLGMPLFIDFTGHA